MTKALPYPVRPAASLLCICLVIALIYVCKSIFNPVALALMFAILLRPIVAGLHEKWRLPFLLSVVLAVLFGVINTVSIPYFIDDQASCITED